MSSSMRWLLVLLPLALAALPTAGAKPRATIAACVEAAQTVQAMQLCKRSVFKLCVKRPQNRDSTMGLVLCHDREGREWATLLDKQTAALTKANDYRAQELKAASDAWRAWVDAECAFHRADAAGGSGEQVVMIDCMNDLTADRVIALTMQVRGKLPY